MSKEVDDASTQQLPSVEEMIKALEELQKINEDQNKIIEQLRVKNQEKDDLLEEQARRIKELEEGLLAGKK